MPINPDSEAKIWQFRNQLAKNGMQSSLNYLNV